MKITEKVAYIKGLLDGMEFEGNTPEKKLLLSIVDLLDSMAEELSDVQAEVETLGDMADEIDNDLGELEEYVYSDEEKDKEEESDDFDFFDDDDDEDDEEYSLVCPKCGAIVTFWDCDDPSEIVCPTCGETIDAEEYFGDDEDEIFEIEDAPDEDEK